MRSVQFAKFLNVRLPNWPSRLNICSPACPDWTRRIQARSEDPISAKTGGSVRVESCPS